MPGTLFAGLGTGSHEPAARRRHTRREEDTCVAIINNKPYPVKDWSAGGLSFYSDSRVFTLGQEVTVTLKFRLSNTVMSIEHTGRVVRKSHSGIALQFLPLSHKILRSFTKVIDDYICREFADSQAV